jgi:hypothetical protein
MPAGELFVVSTLSYLQLSTVVADIKLQGQRLVLIAFLQSLNRPISLVATLLIQPVKHSSKYAPEEPTYNHSATILQHNNK